MPPTPAEAGKSSYDLIDPEALFGALPLEGVRRAVDLGCGEGRYTLPLARRLAEGASVHGVDLWQDGVAALRAAAAGAGLAGVTAEVGDLTDLSNLPDGEADLALMATVLHDLAARGQAAAAVDEVARVLRPGGIFALVEFAAIESDPGPPLEIRLAPDEADALLEPAGFSPLDRHALGPALYLALYRR